MKTLLHIHILLLVCLLSPLFSISQSERVHTIQPFVNPFILKAGNLSNQYTSFSNEFVGVEYATPFIFEAGINYINSSKRWSWSLGLSQMNQQQTMRHTYPDPYDTYEEFDSDYQYYHYSVLFKVTSNFVGIKGGVSYNITERFRINFGVNTYFSATRNSRIKNYKNPYFSSDNSGTFLTYELKTPNGIQTVSSNAQTTPEEQKSKPFILPELSFDYEIAPNFHINFTYRTQFWATPDNYRFKFTETGYLHSTTYKVEELHESRITPQGHYFSIGFKYDILILSKKSD
jgi:hypothetical protein